MKAYCIIFTGRHWRPRECQIIEESEDSEDTLIEYTYCGKIKQARVPKKYVFMTYKLAREFCYYYK